MGHKLQKFSCRRAGGKHIRRKLHKNGEKALKMHLFGSYPPKIFKGSLPTPAAPLPHPAANSFVENSIKKNRGGLKNVSFWGINIVGIIRRGKN